MDEQVTDTPAAGVQAEANAGLSKSENRQGVAYSDDERTDSLLDALAALLAKDILRLKKVYGLTPKEALEYYAGRRELPARGEAA